MISVALTGNVAAGKSTVADVWEEAGVPVVRADELAREAVAPGTQGLSEVREAFGDGVIADDGSLDRGALRDRVFRDEGARRRLEAIVHPRVWRLRDRWMEARREKGTELVASEIPLLFETGRERDFDAVVLVDAPEDERIRRLVEGRGLDPEEARRMVDAQMPAEEKRARSDHVFEATGALERSRERARALLGTLRDPPRMRIDMHMHSWSSWDCLSDPEEVLARARDRGLARIAITDHDRLDVALEMAARHPERVIAGEEVRTEEGIDLIGLYLEEEIPKGTPGAEVAARVRAQGGVVYLPHPYASGKGGGGRLADDFAAFSDVVEVFNARLHPAAEKNRPARELAERRGRLIGAGSDAHTVGEVANGWVELPRHPNEPGALVRALRRARAHGVEASRLVHLASTWAKLRHRLPGAPGPRHD